MINTISDLHGCFKSWLALLDKLHFTDEDLMYVIGDVVDHRPSSVALRLCLRRTAGRLLSG